VLFLSLLSRLLRFSPSLWLSLPAVSLRLPAEDCRTFWRGCTRLKEAQHIATTDL